MGPAAGAGVFRDGAISLTFFVSGAAGLTFQVVWFHRCGLAFGNSVWATSIVLSSFMAGLALGNVLVGWYGHRLRRFLRTYAVLEATVAVTGVALTLGLPALTSALPAVMRPLVETPWLLNLVRFATAFGLLMVPTTAMGATLPILVGAICRWRPGLGLVLGRLYGWNTLGAVGGVVATEVIFIARFGITGSAWVAGLLSLTAAGSALWIARQTLEEQSSAVPAAAAVVPVSSLAAASRLLTSAFLAGLGLMALEVVWFRFLSLFVASSTLTVSLMLAVVLAAIGTGGLTASSWLRRRPDAAVYLPAVALVTTCASVLSYVTFQYLSQGAQVEEWSRILWFACVLTAPTSVLSGVLFTLLGEALQRDVRVAAKAAGWLALANTLGAMCGPLIAAFVLLPFFGMERAFFALALLYSAIGLLMIRDTPPHPRPARWAVGFSSLAAVVVLALFPFGLMTRVYFARAVNVFTADGEDIVATHEGTTATIFLMWKAWMGMPTYYRLVTDGFSMSGTMAPAKRYMSYFVYWPMLTHQAPLSRVLVVCYGVGNTAAAVKDLESVESIDVVDISRDVVDTSDIIYSPADHPLHDRRVTLHVDDGRYFLQTTDHRFDLITGEPPPPHAPGVVNLYTREYFQLIYDRLTEGGITTYWLPVTQVDFRTIIRAFCDVFEDCSLWNGTPSDWMLVGTRHATGPTDEAQFARPWAHPILGPRLRESGFERPEQIGATFLGDAAYLRSLTADTPPLTDDYPKRLRPVETRLSLWNRPQLDRDLVDAARAVIDPRRARRAFETSAFIRRLWPDTLITQTLPFFEHQRIINRVLLEGANPLRQIEALHFLLTQTSLQRLPRWLVGLGSSDLQERTAAGNDDGLAQYILGLRALVARDYLGAAAHLSKSQQGGPRDALLAYALCLAGELDMARQLASSVSPLTPDARHFWAWLELTFGVRPGAQPQAPS